ncbi:MAG: lysophospholipid acyltransferase family protein [Thermodesulfovibrionales bacterium]
MNQGRDIERKRGNKIGFWFFQAAVRTFGLSVAYGFLYFVCLYYLLVDRAAVSSTIAYIRKRFKTYNLLRRILGVYRIFINQGKILIDRYCMISGKGEFDHELHGYEQLQQMLSTSDKGFIMLTAHVGSWQVAMNFLKRLNRTVYLLMRPEDNVAIKDSLGIRSEQENIRIIFSDNFLSGVIEAVQALKQGNIVSIMGDRGYGSRSVEVSFLGGTVKLPHGAFSIAAAVQCPLIVLLSAKISATKYSIDTSHVFYPCYSSRANKDADIKEYVQKFAYILEEYTDRYPFQWFVFHDIWEKD